MARHHRNRPYPLALIGRTGGFTFIEMIAALALMGVLTAIFGMGLVAAMESYYFSRINVEVAQKGQLAMQRISRELTELIAISQADSNAITYDRIENDNDGNPVAVHMGLNNTTAGEIHLTTNLDDDILTDDVQGFSLAYYAGQETWTLADDIRSLSTIRITLSLDRPDDPSKPHVFTTLVHMRNTNNAGGAAPS